MTWLLICLNRKCSKNKCYVSTFILYYIHLYLYLYIIKSWSVTFIITMLLLSHISSHVIHLFFTFSFLYLNFSSPYFQKKNHLLPISSHTYCYNSSNLSFFFFFFFFTSLSPHYFTVILPSSFLYILFLHLNFSSPYFQKKKKKTLLLPISSRTNWCTSSNIFLSFLPLYLPTTLPLYFLPLFYILTLLLPILFCINLIMFSHSIHIFPT